MSDIEDPGDDFTFEDFADVDDGELREFLMDVVPSQLSLALKVCSPALREKFLSNLAPRTAEIVNEEMGFLGALKAEDVEEAQQEIVEAYRNRGEEESE